MEIDFQTKVYNRMLERCMEKLSTCCKPNTMDLYEETESALEMVNSNIDELFSKARECDTLDTRPREAHTLPVQEAHEYGYFISIGFPQKDKVLCKYYDNAKRKVVLGKQEYRGLKTDEQYQYIVRGINQVKDIITSVDGSYHYFIEQCKSGDLHFHARIDSEMSMKDIKLIYHNAFGISLDHLKYFCMIKKYDVLKWFDYETKVSKTYQKTDYKHIRKN